MSLVAYLRGKHQAAIRLGEFLRYLRNWPEVWSAFRRNRPLPPFRLRRGGELAGGEADDLYGIFREIFVERCYTRGFYRPRPHHTVVDIGANIGVFATFLNWQAPGIALHCFEPIAATRQRLLANLDGNGTSGARIHPLAVSDREGSLTLYHGDSAGHTSAVTSRFTGARAEEVRCVDLRGALDRAGPGRIDLLKIDVEGAEADIFRDVAPDVLSRVDRIVVEYHGLIRPGCREAVMSAVSRLGFGRVEDRPDLPDGQLGLIRGAR